MSATEATSSLDCVPIFCCGKWRECKPERTAQVFNPSTGQAIAQVPLCSAEETNQVVQSAAAALDLDLGMKHGELVRTELSHKYTRETVEQMVGKAGMEVEEWYTDPDGAANADRPPSACLSFAPKLAEANKREHAQRGAQAPARA